MTKKEPQKKNRTSVISPFALAAALAILGAGALSVSGANAAAWNSYSANGRLHWNNNRPLDGNRQNRAVVMGEIAYAGPSHLDVKTRNGEYYFSARGARIVNSDGSKINMGDISKHDHVIAYGHFSHGTFYPDFIRDLSQH
jgi:hypothetical protein